MQVRFTTTMIAVALGIAALGIAAAQQATPGVTATEIRIGNTIPYTGGAAVYGTIGRTYAAYFEMVNAEGGINGRTIRFFSYDDGYNPPRTVEQTRRLVESDDVLLIFGQFGTQMSLATRPYLNERSIPQLFVDAGASTLFDPANFPWTMPITPNYRNEGQVYGRYVVENYPGAKVGILYQNDSFGQDYLESITEAIGGRREIVALPYDPTDATVDSQIAEFVAAGVEVFINCGTPRFAVQAIRRGAELGWHPHQILARVSASAGSVLTEVGVENAIGIVSATNFKDPSYAGYAASPDMIAFRRFMAEYYPDGNPLGMFEVWGYHDAALLVDILRQAGDDLSRANIMRIATSLDDVVPPMLAPGIVLNTSPTDYAPMEQYQMVRFDGVAFVPFGPVIDASPQP